MRSLRFIAVLLVLVVLGGGAAAVYAYDSGREDKVAKGVRVGGVDIGGLDRETARAKLRAELLRPLAQPVVVRARGRTFRLTARTARISANIDAMVAEAVQRGRQGNVLSRTWRGLTGGEVDADLEPRITWSDRAVRRLVRRVEGKVERPARNASVNFSTTSLNPVASRTGLRLDLNDLREKVEAAIVRPGADQRIVRARVRRVQPDVTTADLAKKYPVVVTVERGAFRLRLFRNLKHVKSYPIAVGQAGLETPAGLYNIENKAVNPSWHVPNSDWAGELAGRVIPPGPDNPIKARWLGIYAGAGIHGTDQPGSIGSNASHGCIRMLINDVVDLYDRVPVGAPVYIA